MASGLVEKVEKWSVHEETTTENGHTKYKKEEERTTEETKDGETKRNTETTREFSTTPAAPSRACIEDRSAGGAPGSDAAAEDKKDSYVLSDIDDKESFFCTLGNRCLLGDAKKKGIWGQIWSVTRTMHCLRPLLRRSSAVGKNCPTCPICEVGRI